MFRPVPVYLLIFCACLLSACQVAPVSQPADAGGEMATALKSVMLAKSADRSRVARDLVSALRQIEGMQPEVTGLAIKTPREPFAHSLSQALIDARYELNTNNAPTGENVVSYAMQPSATEKDGVTVLLSVGRVKIKRDYVSEAGRTKPGSSLFVLGADPENIIIDSSIFAKAAPSTKIQTAIANTESLYNAVDLPPIIEIPTAADSQGLTTRDTAPVTSFAIRASTDLKRKRNIYELGESNFQEVLQAYQDVDTRVLVFNNDSMRLGSSNKWFVKTMAKKFDASTDAFSVIGCSFGYTKIRNGNAMLALGRAHRVKEELLRNGVPESSILDEGCWSGEEDNKELPSRGVLVVLKRQD